jgi:cell division protein FtsB
MRRVLLFVACVVALDGLVGERSVLQTLRADREQQRVWGELTELRRENLELSRRIQRLRNDSGAIEAMARGELGLIRRGEILVVLTNAPRR